MLLWLACLCIFALVPLFLWVTKHSIQKTLGFSVLVGILSFALYGLWGDYQGVQDHQGYLLIQQSLMALQNEEVLTEAKVRECLEKVELQLPKQSALWQRMGEIYQELGWYHDAMASYEKAYELNPNNVSLARQLVYASSYAHEGILQPRDLKLMTSILSQNTQDLSALNLLAMDAFKKGHYRLAIDFWQEVLKLTPLDADYERGALIKVIDKAQSMLALDTKDSELTGGVSVTLEVSVAPELKTEALDQDTPVFVYVKSHTETGPPLAVKKLSISELPCTITLDERDAMRQDFTMQRDQSVIAGARISLSQQALAQPGDWQGQSSQVTLTGHHQLKLIINEVV